MKVLLSPETQRKIQKENVIAEQKCYEGCFRLRGGEGQVFNLETKGLNPTLWVGFPWGPDWTKPFCWMVAFSAMGRARPAGDEHGRYMLSSKAEPSERSAGWGQAWEAEKRVSPVTALHCLCLPVTPEQMLGVISQSGQGSSAWRPKLVTAASSTWCSLDLKEKGFNLSFIFPAKMSEFVSSVRFG